MIVFEKIEELFLKKQTTYIVLKALYFSNGKRHINLFEIINNCISKIELNQQKSFIDIKYGSLFKDYIFKYIKAKEALDKKPEKKNNNFNLFQNKFSSIDSFINYNKDKIFKTNY